MSAHLAYFFLPSLPIDLSTTTLGGGAATPHAGQHMQASLGSTGRAPESRRGSPAMSMMHSVPTFSLACHPASTAMFSWVLNNTVLKTVMDSGWPNLYDLDSSSSMVSLANVIEKCICMAEHSTRKFFIEELLNCSRLEKLPHNSIFICSLSKAFAYGHSHISPQMHGLQACSIDRYVLQGTSPQSASLTPPHTHATGYMDIAGYANLATNTLASVATTGSGPRGNAEEEFAGSDGDE
ncbi:hypothetical protein BDR03DRAFT_1062066 [Suillus americanus]|nr:hypothetical protein BDR03DRAFT_1062066 [Suillus americanus]